MAIARLRVSSETVGYRKVHLRADHLSKAGCRSTDTDIHQFGERIQLQLVKQVREAWLSCMTLFEPPYGMLEERAQRLLVQRLRKKDSPEVLSPADNLRLVVGRDDGERR